LPIASSESNENVRKITWNEKFREAEEEATSMVHPAMVGITELMTDDNFLVWMESQEEDLLERLSTYEVYTRFQSEMASVTTH